MLDAIDLFAGPGGWDLAARDLGLTVLGIEWDAAAVATRLAVGLPTIHGDVREYGPETCPARGLIASPPCQTFSQAGSGSGRKALDLVVSLAQSMGRRESIDPSAFEDERTALVLEPLRWALEAIDLGRPFEWLAFEQVPTVLPVWEAFAEILRAEGYSVATGRVTAEQYGVPQTRKRAILVARRGAEYVVEPGGLPGVLDGARVQMREAQLPAPTHTKYAKGKPRQADGLLPWVSMADALGWTDPRVVVSNYGTGGDASNRGERRSDEPSATVTSKIDRFRVLPGVWEYAEAETADGEDRIRDQSGSAWDPAWPFDRPFTTVAGRPLVQHPGETSNRYNDSTKSRNDGIRVTASEAAVLQTFPADYPWQGTRGKRFEQIGNAIPPLLARAILQNLTTPKGSA